MSSTDNRVVKMQFDNEEFKRRAAETKTSLSDLNKAVDATGANKGLLSLDSNMQKVQVSASKMAVVTTTALATITNKAVNAGLSLVKSLTFDPIKQGFHEYESLLTKQNTIQNATGKSAKVVKGVLNDLNKYSDKTIYSFGNMTDAITKFVNAGVPLKKSVTTIKGIANAAAFAGASSEEANRAMYAFSQSMSLGFIQLQDWNQIENANMGTQQFKNELLKAAVAAGTLTKKGKEYVTQSGKTITATKGWRDGLKEQWATTEVLNKALGKYADQNTKLGKKAFASAQEVRTFTAFIDTLKESIGSGWSQIFTALIGNLGQATKMWTGLSNAIGGVVQGFFNWVSTALTVWRTMGGFEKTLEGFKNLLSPIGALFGAVGKAFKAAFPSSDSGAGKGLYGLSVAFAAITSPLRLLAKLIGYLVGPLTVFFQIVKIGGVAIGELVGFIMKLVSGLSGISKIKPPGSGGFFGWIKALGSAIADTIGQISDMLDKGKSLGEAFGSIDFKLPSLPKLSMPSLPSIGGMFGGGGASEKGGEAVSGMTRSVSALTDSVTKLNVVSGQTAKNAFFTTRGNIETKFDAASASVKSATSTIDANGQQVQSIGDKIIAGAKNVKDAIILFVKKIDINDVMASVNLAVLSTFMISISRFFNTLSKSFKGFNSVLEGGGAALKSFQTSARADLIKNIGIALLLLAAAMWILSKVPASSMIKSLAAIGAIMFIMNKALAALAKSLQDMEGKGVNIKMIALGASMILFAIAITILASAMKKMNDVDWMSVVKAAAAIQLLKIAMDSLAKINAPGLVATATAMGIVALALLIFGFAIKKFAGLDFKQFAEGILYAATSLLVLRVAMQGFQSSLAGAAALVVVMIALGAMIEVIKKFADLNFKTFGKGLLFVGASLLLLVIAMKGFQSSLSGAAALVVAVVALKLLVGVIQAFAKLNWGTFFKGIGMIAIAFVVLGGLMALMGALSPLILLGAAAILIFGAAIFLLGAGIALLAKGVAALILLGAGISAFFVSLAMGLGVFFQTLALQAPIMKDSMLKILQTMIDALVAAVPMIIDGVKRLFKAIKDELFGDGKKKEVEDGGAGMVTSLGAGVKKKKRNLIEIAIDLLVSFAKAVANRAKDLAEAGAKLIVGLLSGLAKHAGEIVTAGVNLVVKLAEGLGKNLRKLVEAGIQLLADWLHALASGIRNSAGKIGGGIVDVLDAMKDVGVNMVKGLIKGIVEMTKEGVGAIGNLAKAMIKEALNKFKIFSPSHVFADIGKFLVLGLTTGIQNNAASAITAVASMVSGQIAVASEYISGFIQRLDQQAIAARAKADGLAAAAAAAEKAAKKTKTKADDKSAKKLGTAAEAASKVADAAEARAEAQRSAQERAREFASATLLEKAQMRSEDAQNQLDAAKAAEAKAAKELVQANALDKQAKAKGLTKKERKALEKQADDLRAQAKADAKRANDLLAAAKLSAADALKYQKLAGDEAAAAFQAAFDADAKAAADQAAYEKMTDAEKAAYRRKQAEDLQAKATADLNKAKELAYTDLEAANDLARQAQDEANQARQYLNDAISLEASAGQGSSDVGGGGVLGSVVNLSPTDAAAIAMADYSKLYDAATAAAAATRTVEFNQYNTSPEALTPTEVYRQTNNLLTSAADRLSEAAQAA